MTGGSADGVAKTTPDPGGSATARTLRKTRASR